MTLYALVPCRIYDHGITGIYETEERARKVAADLWPKTDGYHTFKIVPLEVGATHPHTFEWGWGRTVSPDSDPSIVVVDAGTQDVEY